LRLIRGLWLLAAPAGLVALWARSSNSIAAGVIVGTLAGVATLVVVGSNLARSSGLFHPALETAALLLSGLGPILLGILVGAWWGERPLSTAIRRALNVARYTVIIVAALGVVLVLVFGGCNPRR
jgi:hypothetical protein